MITITNNSVSFDSSSNEDKLVLIVEQLRKAMAVTNPSSSTLVKTTSKNIKPDISSVYTALDKAYVATERLLYLVREDK